MWAPAALVFLAIPLQLLGYATTCTQGSDGSFLAGAIYSAPLLTLAAVVLVWRIFRDKEDAAFSAIIVFFVFLLMSGTASIWLNTLFHGTPCGQDYSFYPSSNEVRMIILGGYVLLPLIVAAIAAWSFRKRSPY